MRRTKMSCESYTTWKFIGYVSSMIKKSFESFMHFDRLYIIVQESPLLRQENNKIVNKFPFFSRFETVRHMKRTETNFQNGKWKKKMLDWQKRVSSIGNMLVKTNVIGKAMHINICIQMCEENIRIRKYGTNTIRLTHASYINSFTNFSFHNFEYFWLLLLLSS